MKLSVLLITYNHEKYLGQALDGILMQKVDFDYEIVVGEDCSTDSTLQVIKDYMDRYPNKIRLISSESNVGPIKNFIRTYKSCNGKYIAMIDGDDYWTSPDKLQKQADFLDRNSDFSIVFHPIINRDEMDGKIGGFTWPKNPKEEYTIEELLKECFIHTASVMCRNGLFGDFPDWFHSTIMYDWPLHVLNAQYGRIGCLPDVMAVYRIHGGGLWSSLEKPSTQLEYIKFYNVINLHFNKRYDNIIKSRINYHNCIMSNMYFELALQNEERGNLKYARKYVIKSICYNRFDTNNYHMSEIIPYTDKIKMLFRINLPLTYKFIKKLRFSVSNK